MATKDEGPGLLSKVVKFVKNPTTNWADLDAQESDRESQYSKQMLKEMIERKRTSEAENCSFGRYIGDHAALAGVTLNRGNIDNCAAPALFHFRNARSSE